jgi:hypothetical protein
MHLRPTDPKAALVPVLPYRTVAVLSARVNSQNLDDLSSLYSTVLVGVPLIVAPALVGFI